MRKVISVLLKKIISSFPINSIRLWGLKKMGFEIGNKVYLGTELLLVTKKDCSATLKVGDRVAFGPRITIILASFPNNSNLRNIYPINAGNVIIEEDCWIGANVTIYPNVRIGKSSIIAAGSVVNKDVEPYSMVGGVPAKFIKKIEK